MPDLSKPSDINKLAQNKIETFSQVVRRECREMARYNLLLADRAWVETKTFLEWNRRNLSTAGILFALGLLVGYYMLGTRSVMEQIVTTLAYGLAPVGLLVIALLLGNLIRASYLIHGEQAATADRLEADKIAEIDTAHMLHRLALLYQEGKIYFANASTGNPMESDDDIVGWVRRVHPILREWKGIACQIEFINCTEQVPFDEKHAASEIHRRRCGFLHPRLEMIMKEMKEMEKNHFLSRTL